MKVLVACEFSGVVRDAFRRRGHDAWSCDLEPPEGEFPQFHLAGDVRPWLIPAWDLLIAHPPCTYLCNSGVRWLYGGKGAARDPARWRLMEEGAVFFRAMLDAPVPRIAVENPIMHRHAGLPKPTQIIQPWQFGHGEIKATCLWLKNLPELTPTSVVEGRHPRIHRASPGPDRWKERSRTYTGIAEAMAEQWGAA
jgi:hypothetical protein